MSWTHSSYDTDVSAVIVNYNARAMLDRALETLYSSAPHSSLEVVVVDNGSADGSVEMVTERYPRVRCIPNAGNVGLAAAINQGMRAARGRYLLLLNNDVVVMPGAVDRLVEHLDANPHVAGAGSKVLDPDGSIQGTVKSFPTPLAAILGRKSILTRLFPGNPYSRRYLVYKERDFSAPFAAEAISCCALMVRREAIERAGPMDESFFVYWCDVDWCRAMRGAGYELDCVPSSVVMHDEHKGGTRARRPRLFPILDFHRGAYRYYRKWHVPSVWHPANGIAIAGLGLRAALVLASEQVRWAGGRLRHSP